ncbi:MAG: aminotransferase class I/II-fold pyridoxal phosphate-dependent enzyme [Planctomycetota bacterium]|jgi:threonine-phosphate decarboxylase|nr:aminotransferase class I/II-fold pyridoxal phosphate-dependent enzyme [Planctomycetota bacterium]
MSPEPAKAAERIGRNGLDRELIHGGDVVGHRLEYGSPPLDFSASLNPLGPPAGMLAAARAAVADAVSYPDPLCRELTAALAKRLPAPEDAIFLGCGAVEVIHRLALVLRPRNALVTAPAFAEYERALIPLGCAVRRHFLDAAAGFRLEAGILDSIREDLDVFFLCQPNNPTGHLAEPDLLEAIAERASGKGVFLAVDQCFLGLTDNPEKYSLLEKSLAGPGVMIVDSFTKLYGLAGIRLGFGVSGDPALIRKLRSTGPPWTVSRIAQAAGLAALAEAEFVRESRAYLRAERKWLAEELTRLGLETIGGAANYLFFASPRPDLRERMAGRGILIRDCRDFAGLGPGHYRVAVRLREDNRRLIRAVEELWREGGAHPWPGR